MVIFQGSSLDGGFFDNCGVVILILNLVQLICEDIGFNMVILIVVDVSGNFFICVLSVSLFDNMFLNVVCVFFLIFEVDLEYDLFEIILFVDLDVGLLDNCGIV